ncbi:hypothetical protein S7711_03768 [Stachybotrys chartarum IBT 7711]|uniref:L-serine ammonia-lyase n=1 Tax=Stachybotrys chartarum (strain CBS 109288 / IBT 7711) TaxID=1280523 RepID=A0A084AWW1_STACB|nr:hypothetical protein S7711_03768 [Stachybotrys chartarum IBT 7711]
MALASPPGAQRVSSSVSRGLAAVTPSRDTSGNQPTVAEPPSPNISPSSTGPNGHRIFDNGFAAVGGKAALDQDAMHPQSPDLQGGRLPSGSFKSRGIGNYMTRAAAAAGPDSAVHFYCPSGGNAGLACATSALTLRLPATIVVPLTTSALIMARLRELGARVHQVGADFAAADRHVRDELLPGDPAGVYVPPFDHPDIWDGAATIVEELRAQMDVPLDGIVCSVGGGGMVNGIMQGIEAAAPAWPAGRKPRVLAVETVGCDSLNASVRAGRHITLPAITSIATTLGASRVSDQTWRWSQAGNMDSAVVSDADAVVACLRFADDACIVVEPACGAALAPAYRGDLRRWLGQGMSDEEWACKNIVLQVCGGRGVTLGILDEYRRKYASESTIELPS